MSQENTDDLATAPEPMRYRVQEPERSNVLGFVALSSVESGIPAGAFFPVRSPTPQIFGRGASRAEDEHPRIRGVVQRPGRNALLPPFEIGWLSRVQMRLSFTQDGLVVESVGKCSTRINGEPLTIAQVRAGDLIEIGQQILLICVERPYVLPNFESDATHACGEPDEHGIVGESLAIWNLRQQICFAGRRPGHVLIHGASGTGKELVAAAIHRTSQPGVPWVARNAGTLPDSLIDAELYGNARGYPNPGAPERKGLIGAAHQSSLFLDEFAELPMAAQTHLLRVLDAGEYQRLGESNMRCSEFRLIAATNRPLSDLRRDVLARFAFRLELPGLKQRLEDIPLLTRHWLGCLSKADPSITQRFCTATGEPRLAPGFMSALLRLPLDGNVRDLRNLLWMAIGSSTGDSLALRSMEGPAGVENADLSAERLSAILAENSGSIEKTWRALGLSNRFALTRLMKKKAVEIQRRPRRS